MKTKKTLSVISLLITCVISFTLAFSVAPKTNAFASTVTDIVFSDNFQGDISDEWAFARKNGVTYAEDGVKKNMWPTQNGKVVFSQKEYGKMFYGAADMTNYTFTVKVKADVNETLDEYLVNYKDNLGAGMTMNHNIPFFVNDVKKTTTNSAGEEVIDNNTFYGRSVCFNNYAIGFFQFDATNGSGWAKSIRIKEKFATGFDWREWHTIKVVATEEKCDLYLDDVLMVSALQSVFTKATGTSGYVGLTGSVGVNSKRGEDYSTLYYDDFKVYQEVETDDGNFVDASSFTVGQGVNPTYNQVENKLSFPTNSGTSIKLIDNTEHTDIKTSVKFDVDNQPETANKRTAKETTKRSGLLLRASMTTNKATTTLKGYLINYTVRASDGATIIWFRKYNSSATAVDIDNSVYAKFTKAQAPTNAVWLDVWAKGSEIGFTAYSNEQDFVNKTNGITKTITDTTYTSGSVGIFCDAGTNDYQRNFQASFIQKRDNVDANKFITDATTFGKQTLTYVAEENKLQFEPLVGTSISIVNDSEHTDFRTAVKFDIDNQPAVSTETKKTQRRTSNRHGLLLRASMTQNNVNTLNGYLINYYAETGGSTLLQIEKYVNSAQPQNVTETAVAARISGTTTVWVEAWVQGTEIGFTAYGNEDDFIAKKNGVTKTVEDTTFTSGRVGLFCADGGSAATSYNYEATFINYENVYTLVEKEETVMPEVDSFEMVNGASIRLKTDGSSGLRFTVGISKADYDNLAAYNPVFGAVLIPIDLKGAALTLETAKVMNITAPTELTLIDDVYYYNVSLLNIPEESFGRAISARGYVKFTVDGVEYVYYTDYTAANNSRSIQEVAQKIIDSGNLDEFTAEQREIIRKFAGVTFTQSNVAALGKAGGYPRIISLKNGEIFMTYSSKSAISTDNGVNFTNPLTAVTTTADPVEGKNLLKGNLTPVELPNGNVAVFYRAIAAGNNYYSSIRYKIYNVISKTYGEEKIFLENYNPKNDTTGLWEPTPYFTASGELYVYVSVDISGSASYNGIDSNYDLVCTGGYQNLVAVKCSVNGDEITVNGRQIVISGVNRKSRDGMNVITKLNDGSYAMVFEGTVNNNYRVFICYSKDMLNFTAPQQVFYNASYSSGAPYVVTLPDGRIAVSYFTDEDYKGTPVEGYKGKVMRLYVSNSVVKYGDTLTKDSFTRKIFHTCQDTEYLSYGSMAVIGNRFFITGTNGSNDESISVKPLTYYINAYLL